MALQTERPLDNSDWKILRELQRDARCTTGEHLVAARAGSSSLCYRVVFLFAKPFFIIPFSFWKSITYFFVFPIHFSYVFRYHRRQMFHPCVSCGGWSPQAKKGVT